MSFFAALAILQAAVPVQEAQVVSPELDAAHACLAQKADAWVREFDWSPETAERWRWARAIVGQCDEEISDATDHSQVHEVVTCMGCVGISRKNALISEATYHVDNMLREHFAVVDTAGEQR
ncbi:hypothetical protein N8940_00240 [Sphingomonadaceae bacterium]|nr:hypothetical protein [Sphingomonadaceae bacterium]